MSGVRVAGCLLTVVAAAEAGARLLTPRGGQIVPEPVDLRDHFSAEQIRRGARFARPQLALGLAGGAATAAALVALVRRGPRFLRSETVAGGALAGASLTTALSLPPLPLRAIARRRAIAVGLATQSWREWSIDLAKSTAIEAALAAAAAGAVTAAVRRFPSTWWLPAAGGSVVVGGLLSALAPVVLDPVFNDFTPLPEGQTRSDVLQLAADAGVKVGEVYSVDASRRTTAANAYVTGLGPTKRIVLFDTLLDRYTRDEVRTVVAHELAHVRHRDVIRGLCFAAIVAPPTAFAVQQLTPSLGAGVPALALAMALASAPVGLLGNRMSRAVERRADAYSLELAGSPEAFVSFERAIALQNVADLDPPRWVTKLLSTHPSTAERIGAALAFSGARTEAVEAPTAPPRANPY